MRSRNLVFTLLCVLVVLLTSCGGSGGSQSPAPTPNPVPQVSGLSPASVLAGSGATSVTINGNGFMSSSTVQLGSTTHSSTFVSTTQITVSLSSTDLLNAATMQVTVTNPAPGGGSASATFTISNPSPTVSAVAPTTANVGQASTTVNVTGTGFVSTSVVNANNSSRPTTFVSSTALQVTLPASDFAVNGNLQITVSNPAPGGGSSTPSPATSVTVNNPVPVLQSITPDTLNAGLSGTVTLIGTGFAPNSVAQVNGASRTTTYVSGTQLQFAGSGSDLATVGTLQVSVMNPAPGGGTSTSIPLSVVYPTPTITSLSPPSISAGAADFVLTVRGTGFFPASVVQWNGTAKATQYINSGSVSVSITAADISAFGTAQITVTNPTPGGGTSGAASFNIKKVGITNVAPPQLYVASRETIIDVYGGFFQNGCVAQWDGTPLSTTLLNSAHIRATVPAAALTALGTAQLVAANPDGSTSAPYTVPIIANPAPTLNYVSPQSAPAGSAATNIALSGSGFTNASVAYWEQTPLQTTLAGSQLTATVTPTLLQKLGTFDISVKNPGPAGGGTTSSLPFSTYLPIPANDLVYSPWSKLLYASVPSTAGSLGNTVTGIDPSTGNVMSSVYVGSEPNRLALSSDGKVIWVGLDAAGAIRKVDLTTMTASTQINLGGNSGVYNPPAKALDLAVMPGFPDTIAVYTQSFPNPLIRIFDAGVARPNAYVGGGYLAFNTTGTKIYSIAGTGGWGGGYVILTLDANGVTSSKVVSTSGTGNGLKYDNGRVYTTNGTVIDAETGTLLATFYTDPSTIAYGPVAPDSTLGKVFILTTNYSQNQISAFDSNTFVKTGSLPLAGLDAFSSSGSGLVRWGQNGLAFRTKSQIYILQSPVVKDMSATQADVSVFLVAPASATTGANLTYTATVANNGPSTATNVVLIDTIPTGATFVSSTPSLGTCGGTAVVRCNLGTISSGSTAQVQVTVTPNAAGSLTDTANVSATEPDTNSANDSASVSVSVTGADYNPAPFASSISPKLVQAGSGTFSLTVTGSKFAASNSVQWNDTALPTTFVDQNTLTATVDSSYIASLGYAWISVSSPAPGGGISASLPIMTYKLINVDTSQIVYEPFQRKIYASVPSTATQLTGNSIVSIDPATGAISTPVNLGSQPDQLALSDDGRYMFVGLDGSNSISRFNLTTNSPDFSFPLGSNSYGDTLKPRTIAVAPGNPNLLAVDTSAWTGIGIYDIAGTTGIARTTFTGPYTGSFVVFGDSSHVYSYDVDTSGAEFYRWTVGSNGLTRLDDSTLNGMGGFSAGFKLARGTVFGNGGGVANPSTTPPSMLGQYAGLGSVAPDPWLGRTFFLGCANTLYGYCSSANSLLAFDQATFRQTDLVALPVTTGTSLIRWGSDGLAFRAQTGSAAGSGQIYIVRGPFVVPQLGVINAVPALTSVTPNSGSAGSGSSYVTIVGTGFVPGAIARWNGSDRTTYLLDATHLSVAIPASDLANAGTASITVLNPGSTTPSAALSFTIN